MTTIRTHQARIIEGDGGYTHLSLFDGDAPRLRITEKEGAGMPASTVSIYLSPAQWAELALAAGQIAQNHASDSFVNDEDHWLNEKVVRMQQNNQEKM